MEAIIEKSQLQTIAWIYGIANETGADPTSPSDLEGKTEIQKQYWSRYLNWGRTGNREKYNPPNEFIRSKLEIGDPKENIIAIKGSNNVYDIGPENAPLWTALWSQKKQELWDTAKSISVKIQLFRAITALDHGKLDGYDYSKLELETADVYIEALIEYTNATHSDATTHSPAYNLYDLSALIAAYKLTYYCYPENRALLESLGKCINITFNNKHTKKALLEYGILDDVAQILRDLIPGLYPKTKPTILAPSINHQRLAIGLYNKLINSEITLDDLGCDLSDITKKINEEPVGDESMREQAEQFYDRLVPYIRLLHHVELADNEDVVDEDGCCKRPTDEELAALDAKYALTVH